MMISTVRSSFRIKFCLFYFIFSFFFYVSNAQDDIKFGDTEITSKHPSITLKKKSFKRKRTRYIIKKDTRKTLSGNLCFEEETRKMGFEYLVQPKGNPGYKSDFGRLIHNFGVKSLIFFRNGPFWKVKLNRKRKECRNNTADFVG